MTYNVFSGTLNPTQSIADATSILEFHAFCACVKRKKARVCFSTLGRVPREGGSPGPPSPGRPPVCRPWIRHCPLVWNGLPLYLQTRPTRGAASNI